MYGDREPLLHQESPPTKAQMKAAKSVGWKLNVLILLAFTIIVGLIVGFWLVYTNANPQAGEPGLLQQSVLRLNQGIQPNIQTASANTGRRQALPQHVRNQLEHNVPRMGAYRGLKDLKRRPNIFLFLADDLGYGDMSSYGHPTQPWSPLDEMASKGMRFTQLYADTLCSSSRAQLYTGRLAIRSGMSGSKGRIFQAANTGGLPDEEITIAEMLKDSGYVTGLNGKWHLGMNCKKNDDGCHLPFHHGFDNVGTYFPLANNLFCDESGRFAKQPNPQACFLYRGHGTTPFQAPVYHENLTETLLMETKQFLTKYRDQPWFYVFASPQTHDVLYSSKRFRGTTNRGEFGDTLSEMSWAGGEIMRHLVSLGLHEDTLFLFYSDNGAANFDCLQGGSNGLLKQGKGTWWDGGIRVPGFAYWPGVIEPDQVTDTLLTSMDFLPTFSKLAGVPIPKDRTLDGTDITSLLIGQKKPTDFADRKPFYFYCGAEIVALRYKQFKIHFRDVGKVLFYYYIGSRFADINTPPDCHNGQPTFGNFGKTLNRQPCNSSYIKTANPPLIYNVNSDPSERYPLNAGDYRELLNDVNRLIDDHVSTVEPKPEQLLEMDHSLVPCCDPDNNCVCNYPPYAQKQKQNGKA